MTGADDIHLLLLPVVESVFFVLLLVGPLLAMFISLAFCRAVIRCITFVVTEVVFHEAFDAFLVLFDFGVVGGLP